MKDTYEEHAKDPNPTGAEKSSRLYVLRWNPAYRDILMESENSSAALRGLCSLHKSRNRHFTLEYFSRELGLASRSNLSEIINGKRYLNKKHWPALATTFKLRANERRYLEKLIEIDRAKTSEARDPLVAELRALKRKLVEAEKMPEILFDDPFAFLVFCVFGVFGNRATLEQLAEFLGRSRTKVRQSIKVLHSLGYVEAIGEYYVLVKQSITFQSTDNRRSHIQFLKQSISEANGKVEEWHANGALSLFASTVISVRRQDFVAFLENYRRTFEADQESLESQDADMLARLNVQFYPLAPHASKLSGEEE